MNKVCKHFSQCGGCTSQDILYPMQLKMKEEEIKKMADFFSLKTEIKPINHFSPFFYRNKMEFTFSSDEEKKVICGLHSKKGDVFDLEECLIFSPYTGEILRIVKDYLKDRYPAYNKFTHQGFLRHLIVREAKSTHQLMIGLVTTSMFYLEKEKFLKLLLSSSWGGKISSVYWVINDSVADAVIFQKKELIYGEPFIVENIGDFSFHIFIDTFFQTNSVGAEVLYKKIEEYAQLKGKEKILDLYCGVGAIGIFLSKKVEFVWGVDVEKSSIESASLNAKINNLTNISFICADVKKFLINFKLPQPDLVVVNPPRCGLSKKIKKHLVKLRPPYILYSSCNPSTFFVDLKDLGEFYNVEFIEPFDFFPHTPYVECLGKLTLRKK
ncbi:MAG: 23S rRNA (uracil(1939)-C(5))-methyltransferase RlmD [Candidatus Omnitrophica bacterium 4484_70.1]|nr:MAG: 23S rRNA (uracil(1939)-C(5))-methyltransferase RlmD [Candidatus Omnitrophica bacterium 4484_70.1]